MVSYPFFQRNLNDQKQPLFVKKEATPNVRWRMPLYAAGFDVMDIHMTDLISGRVTLDEVKFIGAVGGFSNSDVLGSAKGWAGAFLYNEKSQQSA